MAPSKEEVKVACNALRSDAKKWATASDEMAVAATSAQNLVLSVDQFGRAAENRGLVAAYTTLQQRIAHLLTGADREFDQLSVALNASADTYEDEDAAGAHRMNRIGADLWLSPPLTKRH